MQNHYFDDTKPLRPYTHRAPANPGTLPPKNAVRGEKPEIKAGYWPCRLSETWERAPDLRGTVYYIRNADGQIEQKTISEVGETVPTDGHLKIEDVPKTTAEKEAEVRSERDRLLVEVVDKALRKATYAGQFPSSELVEYRQALLDVPEQPGFPDAVNWPVLPE